MERSQPHEPPRDPPCTAHANEASDARVETPPLGVDRSCHPDWRCARSLAERRPLVSGKVRRRPRRSSRCNRPSESCASNTYYVRLLVRVRLLLFFSPDSLGGGGKRPGRPRHAPRHRRIERRGRSGGGGIVVVRYGVDTRQVIQAVKARLDQAIQRPPRGR